MASRRTNRQNPIVRMIEAALQPDWSYSQYEAASIVYELQRAETETAKLIGSEPARAVALYETLLEACDATTEEVDDSDGEFGTFAGSLYPGWIRARQAAGADSGETARLLLKFMEDDSYGFCNDLAPSAVKVLDREGLESFEREVCARFDQACAEVEELKRQKKPDLNFYIDRWASMLKVIYSHRRDVGKYIDLAGRAGLTKADCHTIATIFQTKRKPSDALVWVERGLGIETGNNYGASYGLGEMRRALLVKLGRRAEALDSAWAEFQADPDESAYEVLVRYAPKAERGAWHEKAMELSEQGDLDSIIGLWLAAKETGRLAARLDLASDSELERLSHYVTEPAAERLAKTHPGVAAKVFRALCMRIVDAGKSEYYFAALQLDTAEGSGFHQRCGLQEAPQIVRVRLLDQTLRDHVGGLGDVAAPIGEIAGLHLPVSRVFIVENVQTGLCCGDHPDSIVFMGLGYGVSALGGLPWLAGAECVYWGDLDTHGFAILRRLRACLPNAMSALMDELTLLRNRRFWGQEEKQVGALELPFLTAEEQTVYRRLKQQRWGLNVRLEQERIACDEAWSVLRGDIADSGR